MQQKNIKVFIFPIIAIFIFVILLFAAGYAYFVGSTSMNTANYQVALPKVTTLTCSKTDCGVTITPQMMYNTNTNATTPKATSKCYVNCTCSGTQGAVCTYNVTLMGTGVTYSPSTSLGSNKEFTAKVTSPAGCSAQNSSGTETQVNTLNNKVVSSCSLTVPASGSVSANVAAEFKWYNLNIDQSTHATRIYSYKLSTGQLVPDAYQQVEYIEATGAQYFSSGITPSTNFKVEALTYVASGNTAEMAFVGVSGLEIFYNGGKPGFWTTGDGSLYSSTTKYDQIVKYTATITPSQKILNVDDATYSRAWSYSPGSNALYVFAYSTSSYLFKGRIYNLKIYKDFNLVREYIPVKRKSDNVAGMYDLVSGTFNPSASSTAFVAGPNV